MPLAGRCMFGSTSCQTIRLLLMRQEKPVTVGNEEICTLQTKNYVSS